MGPANDRDCQGPAREVFERHSYTQQDQKRPTLDQGDAAKEGSRVLHGLNVSTYGADSPLDHSGLEVCVGRNKVEFFNPTVAVAHVMPFSLQFQPLCGVGQSSSPIIAAVDA